MIYILGVNEHRYQAINLNNNPYEREFRECVLNQVRSKQIGHLAEEMNDEALQRENGAQESVCRKIARDLELTHTMCEPNMQERQQIGYINKRWEEFAFEADTNEEVNAAYSAFHREQWRIRENFWFERLRPHLDKQILFICGAQHSTRFSKLLNSKGVKNRIIHKRWKPRDMGG